MIRTITIKSDIVPGTAYRIEVELDVSVIGRVPHLHRTKIQAVKVEPTKRKDKP